MFKEIKTMEVGMKRQQIDKGRIKYYLDEY